MKKNYDAKSFICGMLCAFVLLFGSVALADPIQKSITVVYNGIKIVVDGETITPKDSEGNVVEPFIYDGTTYLPVRAVATALGKNVEWDGKTNSVIIGKGISGVELSSLDYANASKGSNFYIKKWNDMYVGPGRSSYSENFKIAGKEYSNGIGYKGSGIDYITYNLDSQYTNLSGVFGLDDLDKDAADRYGVLIVYGDGKEIYRSPEVHPGNKIDVSIDVKGVNQIKIEFDASHCYYPVFANARLQ
mgnify:CR=1 FL=1|jgi:hypothetical protein